MPRRLSNKERKMYRTKTLWAGLTAAGLVLGVATIALGHGVQGQDRIPSGGHGMGQSQGMIMDPGLHYGYGMGHGMMEGPGTHHGHGMWHGMTSGHEMRPGQGMHQGMKMGPGVHQGIKKDPGVGQDRGLGPRMLYGWPSGEAQDISVARARGWLERKLDWHGNPRLKLGEVVAADDDTITAEIVTREGSLVQKLAIDRHSGFMRQIDD
jgi:hypothetical protein